MQSIRFIKLIRPPVLLDLKFLFLLDSLRFLGKKIDFQFPVGSLLLKTHTKDLTSRAIG